MASLASDGGTLANVLGHCAGVLFFSGFLFLLIWSRRTRRARPNKLAMVAAGLALVWNVASLGATLSGAEHGNAFRLLEALAFCALSLLPAALLHICLAGRYRGAVFSGYTLSVVAVLAHAYELTGGTASAHRLGLVVITGGFGFLTLVATVRILRSRGKDPRMLSSRLLAAMSLFLFAASFVHFSDIGYHNVWLIEITLHHAGIPLALFILIQDYRFVFLDAFIRFVADGILAGIFGVVLVTSLSGLHFPWQYIAAIILLASFALVRGFTLRFLSRIVFREVDPDAAIAAITAIAPRSLGDDEYVRRAFECVAETFNTRLIEAPDLEIGTERLLLPTLAIEVPEWRPLRERGIEVVVPLRLSNTETRTVYLGERKLGRRYLSADLETVARIATYIAQQSGEIREGEIRRLATEAELRALQSQIHPHFLFNALNTLYGIIPRQATAARETLLGLSEILRYFLQSDRRYLALEDEMRIVKAYLSIEKLRLDDRLKWTIDVEEGISSYPIPVLSVEPLVENAVKHGIAPSPSGGEVRVNVRRHGQGIRITVFDSGGRFAPKEDSRSDRPGIGLKNVSRRLELCYGSASHLDIIANAEGTTVAFWVPSVREIETDGISAHH